MILPFRYCRYASDDCTLSWCLWWTLSHPFITWIGQALEVDTFDHNTTNSVVMIHQSINVVLLYFLQLFIYNFMYTGSSSSESPWMASKQHV